MFKLNLPLLNLILLIVLYALDLENRLPLAFSSTLFMYQKAISSWQFLLLWVFQLFQHSLRKFVCPLRKRGVSPLSSWSNLPGSDEDFG